VAVQLLQPNYMATMILANIRVRSVERRARRGQRLWQPCEEAADACPRGARRVVLDE